MNPYFSERLQDGEWHALLPRYFQLAEMVKGKRILDVGCGSGVGALLLAELGATQVQAIDHRPGVIQSARKNRSHDNVSFHEMFLEDLEFPEDAFDLVVSLNVETPGTDPNFIHEVLRVLKKTGLYICAIERTKTTGLETLLPKYGHTYSGERNSTGKPIPQLVNLEENFGVCQHLVQRPVLSYRFESKEISNTKERYFFDAEMPASVEIWYCGNRVKKTKSSEIFLPYFPLVEQLEKTLSQAFHTPNSHQNYAPRQRESTSEFQAFPRNMPGLDEPTKVRYLPQSVSTDISELYSKMKHDFQNVVSQAQVALQERDQYITHLVNTIQSWETRFRFQEDEDPITSELDFDANTLKEEDTSQTIERESLSRKSAKSAKSAAKSAAKSTAKSTAKQIPKAKTQNSKASKTKTTEKRKKKKTTKSKAK